MDIKVDINAEQINKMVSEAILKSTLGEEMNRVIAEQVKGISSPYNSAVEKVVTKYIEEGIRNLIKEKYASQIEFWIGEKLTEKFTKELFEKMWDAFIRRFY